MFLLVLYLLQQVITHIMMKIITMIPAIISRKRSHHGCSNFFRLCPSWDPAFGPLWPSGPMVPKITISINYSDGLKVFVIILKY